MSELRFRIVGTPGGQFRWRRRLRPSSRRPLLVVSVVAVLGTLALHSEDAIDGPTRVAQVNGIEVRANRVLVLRDDSGSMSGTEAAERGRKSIDVASEESIKG